MAEIILVHGIAQQQLTADKLESVWLPALAGGVRVAGFPEVADRIWRDAGKPGSIQTRMALYGTLFLSPGLQGDALDHFTREEATFAEALALEWLTHVAERATKEKTRMAGERELVYVTKQMGAEQGVGSVVRSAISSLSKIAWFAPFGMGFAERFINRSLTQVTRYFTNDTIRAAALDSVFKLIGTETKVVIGHSLGSVIAYEAAHRMKQPLPLLLTVGSPIGLRTLIFQRLRPQPPKFPSTVQRWVNVADRDDFIAVEPDLTDLFGASVPAGARLEGGYTVDNGADPHKADFYLGKAQVGKPVGEVFRSAKANALV